MDVPAVRDRLPALWDFISDLRPAVADGTVGSADQFVARCREFFTPGRLAAIDQRIPGWTHMASFAGGKTLWHVMVALVALLDLDEYHRAPDDHRRVLEWTVLLHDLAKEPEGGRDHRHAFRSAAAAGRVLPACGLPVSSAYQSEFQAWFDLTDTAFRFYHAAGAEVQDNQQLPAILSGARRLFPPPSQELIAAIALHQSITVLEAWPVAAPLEFDRLRPLVDPATRAVLLPLMLADSGGWNLFDRPTLTAMYQETRASFRRLFPQGAAPV